MLGCAAPDVLAERRDRSPCHDPKLFTYARYLPPPLRSVSSASPTLGFIRLPYARFLPPRSGLMNLAVGFNPRLRVKYFPRRVATIEPTRTRARASKGLITTKVECVGDPPSGFNRR